MQKKTEKVIAEMAIKYNLPEEVIKAIVDSQSMCTRYNIGLGERYIISSFRNIRWPGWGCFVCKPGKLKILEKYGRNPKNKQNNKT